MLSVVAALKQSTEAWLMRLVNCFGFNNYSPFLVSKSRLQQSFSVIVNRQFTLLRIPFSMRELSMWRLTVTQCVIKSRMVSSDWCMSQVPINMLTYSRNHYSRVLSLPFSAVCPLQASSLRHHLLFLLLLRFEGGVLAHISGYILNRWFSFLLLYQCHIYMK